MIIYFGGVVLVLFWVLFFWEGRGMEDLWLCRFFVGKTGTDFFCPQTGDRYFSSVLFRKIFFI